jgi:VanZ family protein
MTDPATYGVNRRNTALRYLFLAYCLFIVYGCFIPFHFNLDPNFVRWRWNVFMIQPLRGNLPRVSLSDAVSNVLLYVPFGMLCVRLVISKTARRRAVLPVLLTMGYGLAFGTIIESGQTFSPWRSASVLDIFFNATGALIGAVSGLFWSRKVEGSVQTSFVEILRKRPSLLVLGYLLLGVLVDSFYPLAVTLDRSALLQHVKLSHWVPFSEGFHTHQLKLLAGKGVIFAVISYIVSINLTLRSFLSRGLLAWLVCGALALSIEIGKLFFLGRSFDSENVIIRSFGALAGILILPPLVRSVRQIHQQKVCFLVALCFLLYFELSPFDWITPGEVSMQLARVEWLPFRSYYFAEPLRVLFDLQQKVYFCMPLGFTMMASRWAQRAAMPRMRALFACIGVAVGLEALQILVRSRFPSTTDVIIFSASAWAGIVLFESLQSIKIDIFPSPSKRNRL